MSKEIWSAIGRIGDDLVSAADEHHVKDYFTQKKQRSWLKYAGAAACFLLVFCMAAMIPATRLLSRQKMADQSAEFTTAVSDENSIQTKMQNEYPILLMHSNSDWPHYNTAEEIVDASTEIFSGKITGISFEIVDQITGKADRSPNSTSTNRMLYTLYTVAVTDSYKGETVSEKVICIAGGMAGYHEKEQYDLLESSGLLDKYHGIPVTEEIRSMEIGSEYLFCTARNVGDYDHIINPDQFAYRLDSENAKKIIHFIN